MGTATTIATCRSAQPTQYLHESIEIQESTVEHFQSMRVVVEATIDDSSQFEDGAEFIRITDEH